MAVELRLSSPELPDLDVTSAIDGAPGTERQLQLEMLISSSGMPDEEGSGIRGWAMALWVGGLEVLSTTHAGPILEETAGRAARNDASLKQELIDPFRNGGKSGAIQAVVLSYAVRVTLPRNSSRLFGPGSRKSLSGNK